MSIQDILMKFIMLSNVYTMCVSLQGTQQGSQHNEQHMGQMRHEKQHEHAMKIESITNTTDINRRNVVQKEPKFFDEFECKYNL